MGTNNDVNIDTLISDIGSSTRVCVDSTTSPERVGNWMQTFSGVKFHPFDPRASDINIEDIAHSLGNLCRFAGHVSEFYSVAEHSVRVSWAVPQEYALEALLHDAAEAYLVDVPSPIKRDSGMSGYRSAESHLEDIIRIRFGLAVNQQVTDAVKKADLQLLATESRDLMGVSPAMWLEMPDPLPQKIHPWSTSFARKMFLARFVGILMNSPETALGSCNNCGGAVCLSSRPLIRSLWNYSCNICSGDYSHTKLLACSSGF